MPNFCTRHYWPQNPSVGQVDMKVTSTYILAESRDENQWVYKYLFWVIGIGYLQLNSLTYHGKSNIEFDLTYDNIKDTIWDFESQILFF